MCKPEGRWHSGMHRGVLKRGRAEWGSLAQEGKVLGCCEHGNDLPGCINCGKSFYFLKN
jgi:hypothetical protein